jgi:hypothetical protein
MGFVLPLLTVDYVIYEIRSLSNDMVLIIFRFQLQALVGFEKKLEHLDDHFVEIGTQVTSTLSFTAKHSK